MLTLKSRTQNSSAAHENQKTQSAGHEQVDVGIE